VEHQEVHDVREGGHGGAHDCPVRRDEVADDLWRVIWGLLLRTDSLSQVRRRQDARHTAGAHHQEVVHSLIHHTCGAIADCFIPLDRSWFPIAPHTLQPTADLH